MDTLERLQTLLMKNYPLQKEALTREAALHELGIDSLGAMELFFAIEDEFSLVVPNDKRQIQTLGDVADYVDELMAQQHGAESSAVPATPVPSAATGAQGAAL